MSSKKNDCTDTLVWRGRFFSKNMFKERRPKQQTSPPIDWSFLLQWVLVNVLAWLLTLVFLGNLWIGLTMGLAQWLVLRQVVPESGWWTPLTTFGWLVGAALIMSGLLLPPGPNLVTSMLAGAIIGGVVGLAQWFVLRRWVEIAVAWIPVNALAWSITFTGILGETIAGASVGIITGIALDWLLRNAPKKQLEQP